MKKSEQILNRPRKVHSFDRSLSTDGGSKTYPHDNHILTKIENVCKSHGGLAKI